MSIDNPPLYSGITFNSAFFVEDTGGLSEAVANTLYLRKTYTDTATALETFNGIKNYGQILIEDSPAVNTQLTLKADNSSAEVVCDNGFNSVYINALGIYGTPSSTLAIASGTTATTIGGGSLAVNPVSTFLNQTLIKDTATSPTSTISLNPATSQPFLSLGNTVDTLSIYVNPAGSSDIQVQNRKTLNIGTTSLNVDLNVGTGSRTSAVIHNYSDGNNAVAGSNVHFNNGSSNLSNTNIHNGASSGGIVNIGNGSSATTGVAIGTRGLSTANAVRIGNVSNVTYLDSDVIALGVLGLTGGGAISLATGTNAAGAQVSIGSTSLSAVNIKGGQTNIETTTLNLNTNGTGNTLIGTLGGSNSITINRPLTVGYATSSLTSLTQIGRNVEVAMTTITGIPNTGQSLVTLTIGTAGVYIINYSFRYFGATTSVANCESWFQSSTGGNIQYGNQAYYSNPNALMGSNVICQAGSAVITATSTSTITFYCFITYTGGAPALDGTYSYYSYTRLA